MHIQPTRYGYLIDRQPVSIFLCGYLMHVQPIKENTYE